jgi:hypothetical protein
MKGKGQSNSQRVAQKHISMGFTFYAFDAFAETVTKKKKGESRKAWI